MNGRHGECGTRQRMLRKTQKTRRARFSEQKMSLYGKWMLRKRWALIFLSKKCCYTTMNAQKNLEKGEA